MLLLDKFLCLFCLNARLRNNNLPCFHQFLYYSSNRCILLSKLHNKKRIIFLSGMQSTSCTSAFMCTRPQSVGGAHPYVISYSLLCFRMRMNQCPGTQDCVLNSIKKHALQRFSHKISWYDNSKPLNMYSPSWHGRKGFQVSPVRNRFPQHIQGLQGRGNRQSKIVKKLLVMNISSLGKKKNCFQVEYISGVETHVRISTDHQSQLPNTPHTA